MTQIEAPIGLNNLMTDFKPIVPATADSTQTSTSTEENKEPEKSPEPATGNAGSVPETTQDSGSTGDAEEKGGNEEESTSTEGLFQRLKAELDPELEGDFEESYEGISSFTQKIAERSRESGKDELYNQLLQTAPELEDYLKYRIAGGEPSKYFEVLSQSNSIPADLSTVEAQKQVVTKFLEAKGFDADDIKDQLATLEDTDKLESTAKKYHTKLAEQETSAASKLVEEQAAQAQRQKDANDKYWNGISETIKSGKIGKDGSTVIPVPERDSFYNWLAKPTASGRSQQALDWEAMSEADKLAVQYFIFKKGDVKSLASRQGTTSKVDETLKAIGKQSADRMAGGKDAKKSSTTIPVSGIEGIKKLFNS